MGTEEEIREHEPICADNYDRKSCYTCVHKQLTQEEKQWYYKCKLGKEIPKGKIFEYCPQYERREKPYTLGEAMFGNWFNFG
jgi:hypothetical protein